MAEPLAKVVDFLPNTTVEKAQEIAAEAVGQARGATPGVLDDLLGEIEGSIAKNPLLSVIAAVAVGAVFANLTMRPRRR